MVHYLKGILVKREADRMIVDIHGIGYSVLTTSQTLGEFEENDEIKVYTRMLIKDEEMILIGFSSVLELEVFDYLRTVSGVGIKSALSILGTLDLSGLIRAIVDEDHPALTVVSGIGKKTAQRIVIELKDKFSKQYGASGMAGGVTSNVPMSHEGGSKREDVRDALAGLGYQVPEINRVFSQLDWDAMTLEQLIRESLKLLMKV